MRSPRALTLAALVALAAGIAQAPAALAESRSGGGRIGDGYIDDLQKNPRLIEPGAQNDPVRYRIGAPYEGYEDRQAARAGYFDPGSGYDPTGYGSYNPRRGRVIVEPYGRR